ncbi:MAG: murein L,D-transpeptidase [Bacteroidota bacterium]
MRNPHPPLQTTPRLFPFGSFFILLLLSACSAGLSKPDPKKQQETLKQELNQYLTSMKMPEGILEDSTHLLSAEETKGYYQARQFESHWVQPDSITPGGTSMIELAQNARLLGLLPKHYHEQELTGLIKNFEQDTLGTGARQDLKAWAKMDLLLTDAFLTMARHLQKGHTLVDSLKKNNTYKPETYSQALAKTLDTQDPAGILNTLEPTAIGYKELKKAIPDFLRTANFSKQYTRLNYPYRDSSAFIRSLIKRLKEDNYLDSSVQRIDSAGLAATLKRVQTARNLKVDGKYGSQLVNSLNNSDQEKFLKVAINMDRYRMDREQLPNRYIWVNLPSFFLQVYENETIALESRVVVGKPSTRTPLLTSQISDVITYPTWTIPASIISGEILPQLKRDPGYLARKGYSLFDSDGNEIDPYGVNWSQYARGIPYRVVQGQGDANALGIMKFNFPNKYSVYLHDTNQRSLFGNDYRSLSHGCVRVQNWDGLYKYIIRIDSTQAAGSGSKFTPTDSVRTWLSQKERHIIPVKANLPVYFRYYTAAGKNGKLETYSDIYNEDKMLREQLVKDE